MFGWGATTRTVRELNGCYLIFWKPGASCLHIKRPILCFYLSNTSFITRCPYVCGASRSHSSVIRVKPPEGITRRNYPAISEPRTRSACSTISGHRHTSPGGLPRRISNSDLYVFLWGGGLEGGRTRGNSLPVPATNREGRRLLAPDGRE